MAALFDAKRSDLGGALNKKGSPVDGSPPPDDPTPADGDRPPVDKRPPVDDGAWPAWQLAAAGGILALLVVAALK